jgi:translation initiation factor 5B
VVFPQPPPEDKDSKPMKLEIGTITSIERENVELEEAKVGDEVAICITHIHSYKQIYSFGRHFQETDLLYSHLTRTAIDALKEYHEDLVRQKEIYHCIVNLKDILNIQ